MKMSYQHCGSQRPRNANPGFAGLSLDMSVKTGAPVATSSLLKSRDEFGFDFALATVGSLLFPSCTYIRVVPLGNVVTAIAARDWITAGLIDGLICVHVAPASFERQIPRAYDDA